MRWKFETPEEERIRRERWRQVFVLIPRACSIPTIADHQHCPDVNNSYNEYVGHVWLEKVWMKEELNTGYEEFYWKKIFMLPEDFEKYKHILIGEQPNDGNHSDRKNDS